jgi:hypothetical protein
MNLSILQFIKLKGYKRGKENSFPLPFEELN